jgi:RecJ-like exonuclease
MATIKVKFPCIKCKGEGYIDDILEEYLQCPICDGEGHKVEWVEAREYLDERTPAKEYTCLCGKVEGVLRPTENQIPSGWLTWGGVLLCDKCKVKVLYAGMVAMAAKVDELRNECP